MLTLGKRFSQSVGNLLYCSQSFRTLKQTHKYQIFGACLSQAATQIFLSYFILHQLFLFEAGTARVLSEIIHGLLALEFS